MKAKRGESKRMTAAEQSARFIEAAKKAEADERPEEFEKVLKKISLNRPTESRSRAKAAKR